MNTWPSRQRWPTKNSLTHNKRTSRTQLSTSLKRILFQKMIEFLGMGSWLFRKSSWWFWTEWSSVNLRRAAMNIQKFANCSLPLKEYTQARHKPTWQRFTLQTTISSTRTTRSQSRVLTISCKYKIMASRSPSSLSYLSLLFNSFCACILLWSTIHNLLTLFSFTSSFRHWSLAQTNR